jgi:hypothetical protein
VKRYLAPALAALLLAGCDGEREAAGEPETEAVAHLDPAVEREIEATADAFFGEILMLHEPEAKAHVDLEAVGVDEWEEYWRRLESFDLEIASVTLLGVEPPTDSDPPTAYIGVDAEILLDGEAATVEAYRLPLLLTPEGWLLTDLPFAE